MPILYSVVARGTVLLAKYASCAGNFTEVTEQLLSKIPPHDDKLTYSHGNFLFHYIAENKLVYFCITDDKFQRSRAFLFLNEIKRRFTTAFGDTAQTAIPYAMNDTMAMRGEKLELLVNKADNLATGSVSYRNTSRTLQRSLFWKNVKMYVIMGGVAALAVYLVGAMACGGLKWGNCV
ncbi:hypothetical protein HF086_000589 [Spodoptera exigua]|uniref:Vesicle-associated membrane protein 7 n=1 Tax=Spodoptera exigua TaxID=7107 RepID=A0A922MNQ7_SPOEX|nr:hypothetical protein HF086_000589 [Spodoptera exigua]